MKFACLTEECSHKYQEIVVRVEQLVSLEFNVEKYEKLGTPFFYTVPPIFCGYCGRPAVQVIE